MYVVVFLHLVICTSLVPPTYSIDRHIHFSNYDRQLLSVKIPIFGRNEYTISL